MGGHRGHGDVDRGSAVGAVGRHVPEAADRVRVEQDDLGMMGRVEPDPHALANFQPAPVEPYTLWNIDQLYWRTGAGARQ